MLYMLESYWLLFLLFIVWSVKTEHPLNNDTEKTIPRMVTTKNTVETGGKAEQLPNASMYLNAPHKGIVDIRKVFFYLVKYVRIS